MEPAPGKSLLSDKHHVTEQLVNLEKLADYLLKRQTVRHNSLIVPFIGAGASASANLPASGELQRRIYDELVQPEGPKGLLATLFDEEARSIFPIKARHGILRLSLFEFAAIVSRFAYARERIHRVIYSVMTQATHRPLAYDLLAHLAKHEFIDHFVSLNFDELLDEALKDELPDRLRFITSPDEVPGPRSVRDTESNCCYLFKPFGSLSNDSYKLEPDDIHRYGSESVWRFMLDNVFRPSAGDTMPKIVLIVVGYAAAEPAFEQLMTELLDDAGRNIALVLIDPREELPESVRRFKNSQNFEATHIRLQADLAFDLLLKIMKIKYLSANPYKTWIPVARHRIISALPYADITIPSRRFKVELILQAIKSRGFFTIEAIAEIDRIRKYSQDAYRVIQQMCKEGILSTRPSSLIKESVGPRYLRQDYTLKDFDNNLLSAKLLETSSLRPDDKTVEWKVERKEDSYIAEPIEVSYLEFFDRRFREILTAPEIEVSAEASPSTRWLFNNAQTLRSVSQLTEATAQLFNAAFQEARGTINLYGVWTTGEWLFHDDGWAWEAIGKELVNLLRRGQLNMSLVVAKNPVGQTIRLKRGAAVLDRLSEFNGQENCRIYKLDWWQQNRTLTLLSWPRAIGREETAGIYMRRRLATPLVAPVLVRGADCSVLQDIFERYQVKAHRIQQAHQIKEEDA